MIRERKISAYDLLQSCIYSKFEHDKLSLNDHCCYLYAKEGIIVSNQAVDKKFTESAVMYLKKLLELLITRKLPTTHFYDKLNQFTMIKIKDSVCFQLPKEFADKYPGSGGSATGASIRIQFEYDLLTHTITELSISGFNHQDHNNADETIDNINAGELVIRDLGYVSVTALNRIEQNKAYYLNRLNTSNVYELDENQNYIKINFADVEKRMKKNNLFLLEKEVFIGSSKKTKTRLIVELLPEEIKNKRYRERNRISKKKGRKTSKSTYERMGLNLYLTNTTKDQLPTKFVGMLYGIRWQIEMVFKAWKSIAGLAKIKSMKIERFEFYLYAKLIFIVVNWRILTYLQGWQIKQKKTFMSLYKYLKLSLIAGSDGIEMLIEKIIHYQKPMKLFAEDNRSKRINKYFILTHLNICI